MRVSAQQPAFPRGAIIRTLLKDYAPEELAGGATLFHEHMQLATDFNARFSAASAAVRAANGGPAPAPRGADGRIQLGSSKAAKGYWEVRPGLGGNPRAGDVPFQPWARALQQYRTSRVDLYPPSVRCMPTSGPGFFNAPGFDIIDAPDQQSVFILNIAGPHSWRVVHMDGRTHPTGDALRPTFLGHSTGRWEGDTLVIDSIGFKDKLSWVDDDAHPHSDAMHVVERYSRPDWDHLKHDLWVEDPKFYTKPWTFSRVYEHMAPGKQPMEYACNENNKDLAHGLGFGPHREN